MRKKIGWVVFALGVCLFIICILGFMYGKSTSGFGTTAAVSLILLGVGWWLSHAKAMPGTEMGIPGLISACLACFLLTLFCFFVTVLVWANTSVDIWILPMLVGVVTWFAAFYLWALSKNRSGWWTLAGIGTLIGLVIMILIKDESHVGYTDLQRKPDSEGLDNDPTVTYRQKP